MSDELPWSFTTRLIHDGERADAPPIPPSATPIYGATTYVYHDAAEWEAAIVGNGYVYGRNTNPTVAAFERAMLTAEGGECAVAYATGMAAIHAALLAAGTPSATGFPHPRAILAARDIYGVTQVLLEKVLTAQGTRVAFVDMCDLAAVERAIADFGPDVLLAEQLSNPLLRVVDVARLAALARAAGARLVVDNTIATPIVERPLTLGADIVVHSATKYLGGHGDVSGGVAVARGAAIEDGLRGAMKVLGATLGPFEAALLLRGIKTLSLRVRQQCASAARVASYLAEHPRVAHVNYPALPGHPQHALAQRALGGCGGAMVSFTLRDDTRAAADALLNRLRLILPATSLGDIYTLVSLPAMASHRDLTAEQRAACGISDGLVRLSIGIEDADDILADLGGALA